MLIAWYHFATQSKIALSIDYEYTTRKFPWLATFNSDLLQTLTIHHRVSRRGAFLLDMRAILAVRVGPIVLAGVLCQRLLVFPAVYH